MRKSFFLDRDGLINVDYGYTHRLEDLVFIEFVLEGLARLSSIGDFFIVTNQSGIGRGYYSEDQFHQFMGLMFDRLNEYGVQIKDFRFCPHFSVSGSDVCICRKPSPGMLVDLIKVHGIDPCNAFMLGDMITDLEAGLRAGITNNILIRDDDLYLSETQYFGFPRYSNLVEFADSLNG